MKAIASILALAAILPCYAFQHSARAELTFKDVGTKKQPQSKIFLVVAGKSTPITTLRGTAFGDNLISDRSWIPAKSVTALGAISGRTETQMYVLRVGHDYSVYVRAWNGTGPKDKFRLFKTVKG